MSRNNTNMAAVAAVVEITLPFGSHCWYVRFSHYLVVYYALNMNAFYSSQDYCPHYVQPLLCTHLTDLYFEQGYECPLVELSAIVPPCLLLLLWSVINVFVNHIPLTNTCRIISLICNKIEV